MFVCFIFRERGREARKRGRETSVYERYLNRLPLACLQPETWLATQACALTGNQTDKPLVPSPALSPLRHTSLGINSVFNMSFFFPLAAFRIFLFLWFVFYWERSMNLKNLWLNDCNFSDKLTVWLPLKLFQIRHSKVWLALGFHLKPKASA